MLVGTSPPNARLGFFNLPMRDSMIIYRSFYEAIKELPKDAQADVWNAVFEYSLNFNTINLEGIAKTIFILIKPQLDANIENSDYFPEYSKYHFNWKGGISKKNKRERTSVQYKKWVKTVFERDSYTCQTCKKIGGKLNAHHIKPFALYPELRTYISNGLTLCVKCHIDLHKKQQ